MLRVADVTGSEKSPPGGETAPTMETEPEKYNKQLTIKDIFNVFIYF
jgi:hypothetical protein